MRPLAIAIGLFVLSASAVSQDENGKWLKDQQSKAAVVSKRIDSLKEKLAEREATYKRRTENGGFDSATKREIETLKKELESANTELASINRAIAAGPPPKPQKMPEEPVAKVQPDDERQPTPVEPKVEKKQAAPKADQPRADPAPAPTSESKPKADGIIASAGGLFCFIVYALLVFVLGLLPTWIAVIRKHPNAIPIFLVNLFLGGFCGIGWIWALVWSFTNPHPPGSTIIIEDRGRRRRRRDDDDYDD